MTEAARMQTGKPLRLMAEDAEDLAIISACLQDALVTAGDMAYLPRQRRFALVVSRFCWECDRSGLAGHRRVTAGVHFDGVLSVRMQGLDQDDRQRILELLSIECQMREDAAATITLVFAGGVAVRLDAECIDCRLQDLGESWPVPVRPRHELD